MRKRTSLETRPYSLVPLVVEPEGKRYLGLEVRVLEGKGRLAWITRTLEEMNVSIVTLYTDVGVGEERHIFLVVDLTESSEGEEGVIRALQKPDWVLSLEAAPRFRDMIYSESLFPPLFGSSRGVGIGRAHLTALFVNVYKELGMSGGSLVLCGLAKYIGETVYKEYAVPYKLRTPTQLIGLLRAMFVPSGYGYIEDYSIEGDTITIYVRDDWETTTRLQHKMEPINTFMKCVFQGFFSKALEREVKVDSRYMRIGGGVITTYKIKTM